MSDARAFPGRPGRPARYALGTNDTVSRYQRPDGCWEESLILEKFHGVSEEKSANEEMNGEEKNVWNVFAVFVVDLTTVMQAVLQRYILQCGRRAERPLRSEEDEQQGRIHGPKSLLEGRNAKA